MSVFTSLSYENVLGRESAERPGPRTQGHPMSERPVRGRVEVHAERCQGCGLCIPVCPAGALALEEVSPETGRRSVVFLGGDCRADALCFYACPEPGALRVHRAPRHDHAEP
jgi:NAD-dependent dihydropyrimidine dehydrogenase PreA subunit